MRRQLYKKKNNLKNFENKYNKKWILESKNLK